MAKLTTEKTGVGPTAPRKRLTDAEDASGVSWSPRKCWAIVFIQSRGDTEPRQQSKRVISTIFSYYNKRDGVPEATYNAIVDSLVAAALQPRSGVSVWEKSVATRHMAEIAQLSVSQR